MKQLTIFTVLVLFSFSSFSQNGSQKNFAVQKNNFRSLLPGSFADQEKNFRDRSAGGWLMVADIHDTFSTATSQWKGVDSLQVFYNLDSTINNTVLRLNDPDSGWVVIRYVSYLYDGALNDTSEITTLYDHMTQLWTLQSRIARTFDGAHHELSKTIFNHDTSGAWIPSSRITNHYSAAMDVDTTLYFSWNSGAASWDSLLRFTFIYDANHNCIQETDEYYNPGWMLTNQYFNYFNAANLDTMTQGDIWNGTSWDPDFQDTLTYDASNNLTGLRRMNWDGGTSTYSLTNAKSEYQYNGSNQITMQIDSSGDGAAAWMPAYETSWTYDGNQNNDTRTGQIYDWGLMAFKNAEKYIYYYANSISGIVPVHGNSMHLLISPNLVSSSATVRISGVVSNDLQIELFDSKGALISSKNIGPAEGSHDMQLDMSGRVAGLYYVRVLNSNHSVLCTGKLIKP